MLNNNAQKQETAGKKAVSVLVSLAAIAVLLVIAYLIAVMPQRKDEPQIVAQVISMSKQTEIKMKKQQAAKQASAASSSAASSVANMIRAQSQAVIAAPEVTSVTAGPIGLGEGDFGSGFGSGNGNGMGSGASFFGGGASGTRFLFVLDHSASMKGNQINLRNKELDRTLKSLKGVQYQVLLFAGGAYYAEKGWSSQNETVFKGPGGKTYRFKKNSISNYDFTGPDSGLPRAKWLPASPSNVKKTMDFVKGEAKFVGTDWGMALQIAHAMQPAPDVIFFMADGTGGNAPQPILANNKKNGRPVINTVAMQTSSGAAQFAAVAKGSGGKFTIVDKAGKPIDGFEYLKNPGKFKSRL
ncbi:MAG: hypothetical protein ACI8UO_001541 [Verrucomicrobiales bacterium]|jgi:hypothetical protein